MTRRVFRALDLRPAAPAGVLLLLLFGQLAAGCARSLSACPEADSDSVAIYLFDESQDNLLLNAVDRGQLTGEIRSTAIERGSGLCGGALSFPATGPIGADDDSSEHYAVLPRSEAWRLTAGSLDMWLRLAPVSANGAYGIVSRDARRVSDDTGHLTVFRIHAENRDYIAVRNGSAHSNSSANHDGTVMVVASSHCAEQPISIDSWHHIGINFGGGVPLELFIDGQRQTRSSKQPLAVGIDCDTEPTPSAGIAGNDEPWVLGASSGDSDRQSGEPLDGGFHGSIASLRVSSVRRDFETHLGAVPRCGDGRCDGGERCEICPTDCGRCAGDGIGDWTPVANPAGSAHHELLDTRAASFDICSARSSPIATARGPGGEYVYITFRKETTSNAPEDEGKLEQVVLQLHPDGRIDSPTIGQARRRTDPASAADPSPAPSVSDELGAGSIAVDRDGHIHVVWNMFFNRWHYAVSRVAHAVDTSGSFDRLDGRASGGNPRGLPGILTDGVRPLASDATFVTAPDGALLITFVHQVDQGGERGDLARALAAYDTTTKRWEMIGGTTYEHGVKTLIWDNMSRLDAAGRPDKWQEYAADVSFDRRGVLHIAWTVEDNGPAGRRAAPWLLYANGSRDREGEWRWRKASGAPITTLPMGTRNADIVATRRGDGPQRTWLLPKVTALADGTPIVTVVESVGDEQRVISLIWNGASWQRFDWRDQVGDMPRPGTDLQADGNGWLSFVSQDRRDRWCRSNNLFATVTPFETVDLGTRRCVRPDKRHFLLTNKLRYYAYDDGAEAASVRVFDDAPIGGAPVWKAAVAQTPTRLVLDGEPQSSSAQRPLAALSQDGEWAHDDGQLYIYSTQGDPAKRWKVTVE